MWCFTLDIDPIDSVSAVEITVTVLFVGLLILNLGAYLRKINRAFQTGLTQGPAQKIRLNRRTRTLNISYIFNIMRVLLLSRKSWAEPSVWWLRLLAQIFQCKLRISDPNCRMFTLLAQLRLGLAWNQSRAPSRATVTYTLTLTIPIKDFPLNALCYFMQIKITRKTSVFWLSYLFKIDSCRDYNSFCVIWVSSPEKMVSDRMILHLI